MSLSLYIYSYHYKIHPRLIKEMMRMSPDQFAEILIKCYQKPIRVETCNARPKLPNIQCELIG